MKRIAITALLLLATMGIQAQTYTLPDGAPLLLNPALTGMHNGALRINTVYSPFQTGVENRWQGIATATSTDYRTKSWSKGRQHAGIGAQYTYFSLPRDNYNSQKAQVSAAWHIRSQRNNRQLSLGVEGGVEKYREDDYQVVNSNFYRTGETRHIRIIHKGAGLTYTQKLANRIRYIAGIHLTSLQYASDAQTKKYAANWKLSANQSLLAGGEIDIAENWTLRPSFMYHFGSGFNYAMAGFDVRFQPQKTAWSIGVWRPYEENLAISAGVGRNQWRLLSCYQMHVHEQPSPIHGTRLELSLQYIVKGNGRTALPMVRY